MVRQGVKYFARLNVNNSTIKPTQFEVLNSLGEENKEIKSILRMQNKFSNCLCVCQIHHTRLSLSMYCIKIQAPITRKGFPGNKSRMINRSVCTIVT